MTDYCPFCIAGSFVAGHLSAAKIALVVLVVLLLASSAAYLYRNVRPQDRELPGWRFWLLVAGLLAPVATDSALAVVAATAAASAFTYMTIAEVIGSELRSRRRQREWAARRPRSLLDSED